MTDAAVPVIIQGDDEIETHIVSTVSADTVKKEEALGKQIIVKGKKRASRRSGVNRAAELGLTEEKTPLVKKPKTLRIKGNRRQQQQQQQAKMEDFQEDMEQHRTLLRSNSNDASSSMMDHQQKASLQTDTTVSSDTEEFIQDKENNTGRMIFGFKKQHGKSMQSMMKKAMEEEEQEEPVTTKKGRSSKRSTTKQPVDHGKRRRIQRQIELLKDDRHSDEEEDEDEKDDSEEEENDDDVGQLRGSEGYFQALQGKSATSNNTLSKLPVLEPQEFNDILEAAPTKHAEDISTLFSMHKLHFNEWFFKLHAGFNLIFYGYGSKRRLINDFCRSSLTDGVVLMINGFFPSITIKASLSKLVVDALDIPSPPAQMPELLSLISQYFSSQDRHYERLYLIVHNIDGNTLRNEKSQMALSMLADLPNIHLIATMDHINAGLLWDNVKISRFNWLWHDATTFDDYLVETSFENSLLMRSGELGGARGIQYVLRSLTSNGRGVFRVLAEHQLMEMELEGNETGKANESVGLPYHRYYDTCRESFLVSNDTQLRSLLTEFIDHKIIHAKRSPDGTEVFYIPLDKSTLCNILEEVSEQ
ncbi:origin recognition complex subunit 2-domain-containing protein [Phascolomyces articulosus]|uniref:Origin recognition complex subunit 2 n=1 Tax=Phascolomyces articulosus TaxID=60185 RepID=A0AAD5JVW1_9FUNG|nr:origin recognition complex subunit 2-domain-containing protein [Phascolomyces articulosus]